MARLVIVAGPALLVSPHHYLQGVLHQVFLKEAGSSSFVIR